MTETVTTREASPRDIPQILEVLKAALGEPPGLERTPELFSWKHILNPFGESIVLVAEEGEELIGVRAFMRWDLITPSGHTIRSVRAVDTATHPKHARKGVFRRLTLEAVEVARDRDIHLIFNTPNAKSGAGYLKMGWFEVGWTGVMVRPRLGRAVTVPSEQSPSLEASLPTVRPARRIRADDRPALGLRTPRSAEYLGWRFDGHPAARYGWVDDPAGGGAVARVSSRDGRSETVLSDLLGGGGAAAVRRLARSSRSRYLATWFSPGSPERRQAIAAGLMPVPRLKTLRIVANPLVELDIDVSDLASWDLATSDLELL